MTAPTGAASWNEYLGSVWGGLLAAHDLDRAGRVAEVGPGFADKVGRGLAECGFRGTLFVVEPNALARDWVVPRYRAMLPDADVVAIREPLAAAGDALGTIEALVMNHVLDDLVLSAAVPPAERDRIFGAIRPGNGRVPEVMEIWQQLLAAPRRLAGLREHVVDDLDRLIAATDPRVFAASQYASWFLTRNQLAAVDRLGASVLDDLAARIGLTSDADRAILARRGQDPARWLVRERRPAPREARWATA